MYDPDEGATPSGHAAPEPPTPPDAPPAGKAHGSGREVGAPATRRRALDLAIGLALAVAGCLAWSLYGFEGELWRDDAVYLYAGQRMAEGVPPYVSIFDVKTPLPSMLCGWAVMLGRTVEISDVLAARLLHFALGGLALWALYGLARSLSLSRWAGAMSSLSLAACWTVGRGAVSGPRPKLPMILLEVLFLHAAVRRRWLLAGTASALAACVWQPAALFVLCGLALALARRPDRWRATARFLLGAATPTVLVSAWFAHEGAFDELVEATVTAPLVHLTRDPVSLLGRWTRPVDGVLAGLRAMAIPLFVGLVAATLTCLGRARRAGCRSFLREDAFAGLGLSIPLFAAFSVHDFQGAPDYFPLLPASCIGFAMTLEGLREHRFGGRRRPVLAGLLLIAVLWTTSARLYLGTSETRLRNQQAVAAWLAEVHGDADGGIVSIGLPELLVLLRRANPNRFVFVVNGFDAVIEASEEGGFEGWLERLRERRPALVGWGPTEGVHVEQIRTWLESEYTRRPIGPFEVWERNGQDRGGGSEPGEG